MYLKANCMLKNKFFKNIRTQNSEKHFLAPKWGVDLHTRSTYTQVNTVLALKKKSFICSFIYNNKPVIKMEGGRKSKECQ